MMSVPTKPTKPVPLAFMLLWSPLTYDWENDDLPRLTASLRAGIPPTSSWSVNNFPKLIGPGHRVFMRRTSSAPLGVIGEGIVASDTYWAPSYKSDNNDEIPYVDIEWLALTPTDPLSPNSLADPGNAMTRRWASAIYDSLELDQLDSAWSDHLADRVDEPSATLLPSTRKGLREERAFQGRFRRLVLAAHGHACVVCGINEESMLDAAHLVPHSAGGLPTAENGRPLCPNHHRALDRGFLFWSAEEQSFQWHDPHLTF